MAAVYWFVIKRPNFLDVLPEGISRFIHYGWGQGYVAIRKDHPWYNMEEIAIDVHGGITFDHKDEDYRILGFDTAHFLSENMTYEKVIEETLRFYLNAYLIWKDWKQRKSIS